MIWTFGLAESAPVARQRLSQQRRDHSSIVRLEALAIGIEDPHNMCIHIPVPVVRHCQRLRKPFRLVIN